jgi:hypothetical protein|tara:strand:+ start:37 stop:957 length:921 start_codon:yes stop_codon:yes gene_type:complete
VIEKTIQVIYVPGTFGNCLRWLFYRFIKDSPFKDVDSPWDEDRRVHGFFDHEGHDGKFRRGHQINDGIHAADPDADKIVINFEFKDLLFVERCKFYRNPGWENDEKRFTNIINLGDATFVENTFGKVTSSKSVAKELLKIQFHNIGKHTWWNNAKKFLEDDNLHQFDFYSLWDHVKLTQELKKVSDRYNLDFVIDQKVIHNVVDEVKRCYPVITRNRANQVLDAIVSNTNIDCVDLDIYEQAFIETELEKIHDSLIFPYGSQWFKDTHQIIEFINTYPTYLRHMNPRLPWYNNMKNPFYLTGKIDE